MFCFKIRVSSVFNPWLKTILLLVSVAALAGCATRQAEINRLQTALVEEQQVINRDGRYSHAANEVVDRFNRQTIAELERLEK